MSTQLARTGYLVNYIPRRGTPPSTAFTFFGALPMCVRQWRVRQPDLVDPGQPGWKGNRSLRNGCGVSIYIYSPSPLLFAPGCRRTRRFGKIKFFFHPHDVFSLRIRGPESGLVRTATAAMSATPQSPDNIDRHEAVAGDVKHNRYLPSTLYRKPGSVMGNDSPGTGSVKEGKDLEGRGKEERVSSFRL